MKEFLELISKIRKTESSNEDSMSSESETKEECPLNISEISNKIDEYKQNGNEEILEFINQYSFNEQSVKVINDKLNQLIISFYENKEYKKLSHIMDEFHRDNNILDGSILCEMILSSFQEDDLNLLTSLLMGDYANYWNEFHVQKAWDLLIKNMDNSRTNILRSLKDSEYRNTITDILL